MAQLKASNEKTELGHLFVFAQAEHSDSRRFSRQGSMTEETLVVTAEPN